VIEGSNSVICSVEGDLDRSEPVDPDGVGTHAGGVDTVVNNRP
jgi:hypothetical protein